MTDTDIHTYQDRLLAIANTRLIFNTIGALEAFLGTNAIHSNGIRRVYDTLPRARAAYRDLAAQVAAMTDDLIGLDGLLEAYRKASDFYSRHFARRADRPQLARQLLAYCYLPFSSEGVAPRIVAIFDRVKAEAVDVPLLMLMLLGALPGYGSKEGDAVNIDSDWRKVMDLIDGFTHGCGDMFDSLPALAAARTEANKCRLMLIHHAAGLLRMYESFADATALYGAAENAKSRRVDLDLAGYWNECGGRGDGTSFWQIEDTVEDGVFFATWWYKNASNQLVGMTHTMHTIEDDRGRLVMYLMHPEALKHRIEGLRYEDRDQVWYHTEMPEAKRPDCLPMERTLPSSHWKGRLPLTRVTDPAIAAVYDKWLNSCEIVRPHADCEYELRYQLWAITLEAIYITDDVDGGYFRVPYESEYELEKIGFEDNVGILTMGGRRYIAFDDLALYIPIDDDAALLKYGITKVDHID